MRRFALAIVAVVAGCAELGVIGDGTSVSVGTASRGFLIDGVRLPDHGDGYLTREVWRERDNRFGTDELVDLVTGVAHRMRAQVADAKLVVADLSGRGGGERVAFHRSHQTGRDVDLLYYLRDASGAPFEADAMHVFNAAGRAVDGSGLTVDVPRTWLLVKEIITAPEAPVQWIFMYEPLARRLIEHAERRGEPEAIVARARKTLKQPGDSARHDDHMHVRVYCSAADRAYGCRDLGPMELLAERMAEPAPVTALIAALSASAAAPVAPSPASAPAPQASPAQTPGSLAQAPGSLAQASGSLAQSSGSLAQASGSLAQASGSLAQASGSQPLGSPAQPLSSLVPASGSPVQASIASSPAPVAPVGLAATGSIAGLQVPTGALAGLGARAGDGSVMGDSSVSAALAAVQQRLGRLLRGRLEPHLLGR